VLDYVHGTFDLLDSEPSYGQLERLTDDSVDAIGIIRNIRYFQSSGTTWFSGHLQEFAFG
jgi:hypothetical protein